MFETHQRRLPMYDDDEDDLTGEGVILWTIIFIVLGGLMVYLFL